MGINVSKWNEFIHPTDDYHFHVKAPDISIQFLHNNCHNLVLPKLYLMNKQELKNYGIDQNHVHSQKEEMIIISVSGTRHIRFGNQDGGGIMILSLVSQKVKDSYKGTLIEQFLNHDVGKGQELKTFDLGEY